MGSLISKLRGHEETIRLDIKTDEKAVEEQALWAGILPGMRVADLGFGSGKTTRSLHKLIQPDGEAVGVDIVEDRVIYAQDNYGSEGLTYISGDIRQPLDHLGLFDFIWVRFVFEYYHSSSFEILKNISSILKPGGILCIIDLDYNCLIHSGIPERLERTLFAVASGLEKNADFDPYVGRKLYSYFYDLCFSDIKVNVFPHHLLYGSLNEIDAYSWQKKMEAAGKNSGHNFEDYDNGFDEFITEFMEFFTDHRRFTYTPAILCRGRKPEK